ncbi:phosphatase PAP2 family protein [Quisquiliibacterium transsilvanicum]|uniref:Membrane-associated phospholipid phosphatase n=1 Tax=Quisquiliibacterium transsilvanicum TaxID=1549638 RepID=A0A7W8HGW3_9BURK|nr:phosphatase PAP2 family protein [Quisquiliibacterium transsilvanicum]MBB5271043.1 membrane-associated phospholipid phosphatase [Quisquiliibacterium transsilvanicum]
MRELGIIAGIYAVAILTTAVLAAATGSPFTFWFPDATVFLTGFLAILLTLAILWDGALITIGMASRKLAGHVRHADGMPTMESMRRVRFFTCGVLPIPMLMLTAAAIHGTSNITLLSLDMLQHTTQWRDPILWHIEGTLLAHLKDLRIDAVAWDRLYHSAWAIEVFAAFALVVVGRGPRIILRYCVSMILLFYVGRLLGMLNPVMGPAFYRPDLFAYLDGSATQTAMKVVAEVMALPPSEAMQRGGILLGGVSAMPSLHVAMVATTAFWLAVANRRTLFLTVPWVLAVWTSTVLLGWHYILDGASGMLLAGLCVLLTRALLRRVEPLTEPGTRPPFAVGGAHAQAMKQTSDRNGELT